MNQDSTNLPREERDLRLTALALGELSAEETAALQQLIASDPELAREFAQRQQTVGLVRESAAMERKASAEGTPLRLDDARRQQLLAAFKQPVVTPVAPAPRRVRNLQFLPLALAAALVGLLVASVLLPSLATPKARASRPSLNLPRGGSPDRVAALPDYGVAQEKRRAAESELYVKQEARVRSSGRGELGKLIERKGELALTENASPLAYDTESTKAAPAPKVPSIALALPMIADIDGEGRELKELAGKSDVAGRGAKPMSESLVLADANRNLGVARGYEAGFGNSRGFFDESGLHAAAPGKPASQPVSNNRWDNNDAAAGTTFTTTPQTPAANLGTLWAETSVGQRAVVTAGASEFNRSQFDTPSLPLGSVVDNGAFAYVNGGAILRDSLTPPASSVPPPAMTPEQAQSIVEARRLQLQNGPASGPASILPPAGFGDRLSVARDQQELAERQIATHYAELVKQREATGKPVGDPETAWGTTAQPASPNAVFRGGAVGGIGSGSGGYGGRGGGSARAGLLGGAQPAPANEGMLYAGANTPAGLRPGSDGYAITDLTVVDQKVDGLKDAPLSQAPESVSIRASIAKDQSDVPALGVESKSKGAEHRFGRADDFVVSPEMLDAVKLPIQNTTARADLAGGAAAKDNLSPSRPSIDTTPGASVRKLSSGVLPAPAPPPPGSSPAANEPPVQEFLEDNIAAYATLNAALVTNGVVNYFADVPVTAGNHTLTWKFNGNEVAGNNLGFGVSVEGDKGSPLGRTSTGIGSRVNGEADKVSGLRSGANGRVEVQLPALADGGLEFRSKLATAPRAGDRLAGLAESLQSQESAIARQQSAGVVSAGNYFYRLQSGGTAGSVVFNPNLGTNAIPAKTEKLVTAADPELAKIVSATAPTPQPEVLARDNAFSTFSLNVADVSFKLAAASLEKGAMPDAAGIRSEEFINAFDYRDPLPMTGVPVAFAWDRARYPFAHNRDVLRFSVKTAAQGRDGGRPLNIVLLLDNSGSMERADRVQIIQQALRTLAAQLQPQDKLSVVTFSRTARLWADGVSGTNVFDVANKIAGLTPEGGTNLEEALDLAYRTALRHYAATAMNRVVLLTDGAANLGNVEPAALKSKVENFRQQGVALDCFGIGWEGFNDDLLEQLSRNGDGRYGFVNSPEEAATEFAGQLAGALKVAASDVKMQVEFNPKRVTVWRQIGYAKHQLTKEQFRDNKVDAAEISASEAGNALYVVELNPNGEGPVATVRARFRVPQTSDYREHEWVVPFGSTVELEQAGNALRLAASAAAFSEWLAGSPFAGEVTTDRLLRVLSGVPEVYGADPRPKKLEWMIRQAKSISGK